jgi:hypothetical protein
VEVEVAKATKTFEMLLLAADKSAHVLNRRIRIVDPNLAPDILYLEE